MKKKVKNKYLRRHKASVYFITNTIGIFICPCRYRRRIEMSEKKNYAYKFGLSALFYAFDLVWLSGAQYSYSELYGTGTV